MTNDQYRVRFDADVSFVNGGGLRADGFMLDIAGSDIDDDALGDYFVRHLGLLMVGDVRISEKSIVRQPHKGSRGLDTPAREGASRRLVDLSDMDTHLVTGRDLLLSAVADIDAVVIRTLGSTDGSVERSLLLPFDVSGRAVLLHTGGIRNGDGHAHLTADAATWLVEQGAALVGVDSLEVPSALSEAGIPVVEHLHSLERLPPEGFRFHAVPGPFKGAGRCPVRPYAVVGGG